MSSSRWPTCAICGPTTLASGPSTTSMARPCTIKILVKDFPAYDKISAGFPGYVKDGITKTAPNLNSLSWKDVKKILNSGESRSIPIQSLSNVIRTCGTADIALASVVGPQMAQVGQRLLDMVEKGL